MEKEIREKLEEVVMLATLLNYRVTCFESSFEAQIFLKKDNKNIYLCLDKLEKKMSLYIYFDLMPHKEIIREDYNEVLTKAIENL